MGGGDDDRYLGYRHDRLRGFGNRLMDRQTDRQLLRLKIHARFKYRKFKLESNPTITTVHLKPDN